MRRYELMVIIPDTLDEDAAAGVLDRVKTVLADEGGKLVDEAWWGRRRFAYEIDKRTHGFYAILDFEAETDTVVELERQLKISDNVRRFKTVRPEIRVRHTA